MLAGEVERLADRRRPQPGDDRQLLLEALEALAERRERDAVGVVLLLVPAGAEAELDATARHLVDAGDGDRQHARASGTSPGVTSVPRRIVEVSRARPASVIQASVGPGSPPVGSASPIAR